jgi:coproporphyrinogen III oxidase-like Fe-S oxidoreductase
VRWWNVLHPQRYARLTAAGASPAAGREQLTRAQRRTERTLLGLRLVSGLELTPAETPRAAALERDGLLAPAPLRAGVARLTLDGRLMADHVARELVG